MQSFRLAYHNSLSSGSLDCQQGVKTLVGLSTGFRGSSYPKFVVHNYKQTNKRVAEPIL